MWKFLEGYFTFSTKERRGIIVLLVLSASVLLGSKLYVYFKPAAQHDNSKYQAEVDAFVSEYKAAKQLTSSSTDSASVVDNAVHNVKEQPDKNSNAYFQFDPNTIGVAEWMRLGFSEKQAQSIEKYKAHGGTFYKPEDLKRVYVIGEEGYTRLASFIKIDTVAIRAKRYAHVQYFMFDPNAIGVDEWMKLGFSEKQARSIENYKATGAVFHKPEDLKKVYVIGDEGYNRLRPYIKIARI